ncbi:hypothetical protein N5853_01735 [Bartonella sp. HY329]|uniref:hypothetical protein n=1 Tax=unclassified Bartonella TaxID=2645622 RepID=UPI0021C5AE8C|nr:MULTISPECIES: hypothetical protein [unclassified Bartonella]UXM95390.1 hypothetical protein N5853_01735 [Bartonella sp. HY329]UXN09715.1 hypothetical protein N5852_01740 [Bartonella sp. HY328]
MNHTISIHVKKRGRPKIKGKLREANGRVSRAKEPVQKLAIEARAKAHKITIEQAKDPRAQTYLGRLSLFGRAGGISADQYQAATRFLEIRNDYRRSLLSPGAYYEATGIKLGSENMEEYTAWVQRARRRYSAALKAIQEAQFDNAHENLYAAIQYILIDDRELPHLLGALRMVLNALHRHFVRFEPNSRKNIWAGYISLGEMNTLTQNKD